MSKKILKSNSNVMNSEEINPQLYRAVEFDENSLEMNN